MPRDHVRVRSSPAFHQDSEPFVLISKSTATRDGSLLCSCESHSSEEETVSPKSAEPSARPGAPQQRPSPQDDHGWVCVHPSNCYSSCTCGVIPQSAIFPDTLLACAQTSVSGKSGTEGPTQDEYCLQKSSGCGADDGETGPLGRCEGCTGPRHCEHEPEFAASQGGCSLSGVGTASEQSPETGRRESEQGLYLRELDDLGITCLSYSPSALTSGAVADLCRPAGGHSARQDRRPPCQDTCQHLSCKRCKSQPVPERTRCSLCSDDTSSLMSLKQGDCHTSTFRTNRGSTPIIYSLPQWPRYLLLQNIGAQATTAVYKD